MSKKTWVLTAAVAMTWGSLGVAHGVDPGTACASGAVVGVCNGISGFPVKFDANSPTGVAPLCPPYTNPFVVFAPHPDDETLAMAGAIRAAKDAGRKVIVELMTNGDQSGFCGGLGLSTGTGGTCGVARCKEFMAAMQALGVDGVTVNNFGDKALLTIGGSACPCDPAQAVPASNKVPARVQFWTQMLSGGNVSGNLSLRGTVGYEDGNEVGQPICHADHLAVRMALKNAAYADTKWYSVYSHADPNRFSTTTGIPGTFAHEPMTATQCSTWISPALSAYKFTNPPKTTTNIGYSGAAGAFNNEISDCLGNPPPGEDFSLKSPFLGCFEGNPGCSSSCVAPDGQYISHFTGRNCDGTESYYLPYNGYAYRCRPYPSHGATCGSIQRTVTNYSYRYNGQCYANAWPNGNTLSQFVTVYRINGPCGEGSCVSTDGQYISHFTGSNCDGTESYYLPYDGYAYQCRPYPNVGANCGTVRRTVTHRSYRYAGQCYVNAWPGGNTLSDFVTVYR